MEERKGDKRKTVIGNKSEHEEGRKETQNATSR